MLVMESTYDARARARMVVLHELVRESRLAKALLVESFNEEASLVAVDVKCDEA